MLNQQLVGGIHRRRPGTHDGNGQRLRTGANLGGRAFVTGGPVGGAPVAVAVFEIVSAAASTVVNV